MRAAKGSDNRFVPENVHGPVRHPCTEGPAEHSCVVVVSEHAPEQSDSGGNVVRPIEQPLDLVEERGGLRGEDVGGHRVAVCRRFHHKRGHVLKGKLVPVDPANENLLPVDATPLVDAGPERRVGPAVEGRRHSPEPRTPHGVPAARIAQHVPPSAGAVRRAVEGPSKHHRARPGNDREATSGAEGGLQGNAGIVDHLYVDGTRIVCKDPAEVGGERLLLLGTPGTGHPCTDRQAVDGTVRLEGFPDQRGQDPGRLFNAGPVWIGAGPLPIDSRRTPVALCEE